MEVDTMISQLGTTTASTLSVRCVVRACQLLTEVYR
jgi:hypothetical protein